MHALEIEIMDQSGVKPQINGRYELIEVEPSDHFMSRAYRDRWIRIFTNAYQRNTLYLMDILHKLILTNP